MRMTKRKQQIIDLLATEDPDTLKFINSEWGLFGFHAIADRLFNNSGFVGEFKPTQSERQSLYRTLRGMVKDGQIVTRKVKNDESFGRLAQYENYYHLPDKVQSDLDFIESQRLTPEQREALLKKLFG